MHSRYIVGLAGTALALAESAAVLSVIATNDDSGAKASSIQNKYATLTAAANMLASAQARMITLAATPFSAAATSIPPTNAPGPFDPVPTPISERSR